MEYRGKQIALIQGTALGRWAWSVDLGTTTLTGKSTKGRAAAITQAKRAINNALGPAKRQLKPRD